MGGRRKGRRSSNVSMQTMSSVDLEANPVASEAPAEGEQYDRTYAPSVVNTEPAAPRGTSFEQQSSRPSLDLQGHSTGLTDQRANPDPTEMSQAAGPSLPHRASSDEPRGRQSNGANSNESRYPSFVNDCPEGLLNTSSMDSENSVWSKYNKVAEEFDKDMIEEWKDGLNTLLIFTGLFSAILTAFLVAVYPAVQGNASQPSASLPADLALYITILWFMSLVLSIITSLTVTVVQQWIWGYSKRIILGSGARDKCLDRQLRYDGVLKWHMSFIIRVLPLIIQASVLLFLAGLVIFTWTIHIVLGELMVILIGLTAIAYAVVALLPLLQEDCPYHSAITYVLLRMKEKLMPKRSATRNTHGIEMRAFAWLASKVGSPLELEECTLALAGFGDPNEIPRDCVSVVNAAFIALKHKMSSISASIKGESAEKLQVWITEILGLTSTFYTFFESFRVQLVGFDRQSRQAEHSNLLILLHETVQTISEIILRFESQPSESTDAAAAAHSIREGGSVPSSFPAAHRLDVDNSEILDRQQDVPSVNPNYRLLAKLFWMFADNIVSDTLKIGSPGEPFLNPRDNPYHRQTIAALSHGTLSLFGTCLLFHSMGSHPIRETEAADHRALLKFSYAVSYKAGWPSGSDLYADPALPLNYEGPPSDDVPPALQLAITRWYSCIWHSSNLPFITGRKRASKIKIKWHWEWVRSELQIAMRFLYPNAPAP